MQNAEIHKSLHRSSWEMLKDVFDSGLSQFTRKTGNSACKKQVSPVWNKYSTVSFTSDAEADFYEYGSQGHGLMAILQTEYLTWLIPGAVGVLTAVSGKSIEYAVTLLADMRMGYCSDKLHLNRDQCGNAWVNTMDWFAGHPHMPFLYYVLFSTLLATTSAFLTHMFAPMARGSGIPEIKTVLGGFTMPEVLEANTLCIKIVGLALSVAAGLSCGKEGPLVHIACCWSNLLSKIWPRLAKNESKRIEMASCACAAGVAVAFGAPLGGVLFSMEEASSYFPARTMIRCFFAGACASLVLLQLSENGKLTMFEVTYQHPPSFIEWPIFVAIGCLGGCIGALFIHCNIIVAKKRAPGSAWRKRVHNVLEVGSIAFLTAVTSYPLLSTRVMSNVTIHALFQNCRLVSTAGVNALDPSTLLGLCSPAEQVPPSSFEGTTWMPVITYELLYLLATAGLLRYVQMIFTFGCGAPSGLFVPSLFTGATLGRMLGIVLMRLNNEYQWTAEIYLGVYAMLGAAAVLGGVCRVTISLVVIMFELTGGLQLIVPFMIVCITAKTVGDYFTPGIYDYCISIRKYPHLHEPDGFTFQSTASQCMDDQAIDCLHPAMNQTCAMLLNLLQKTAHGGFPITASPSDHTLLGYMHAGRLRAFISKHLEEHPLAANQKAVLGKFLARIPSDVLDLSNEFGLVDESVLRVPPNCPAEQVHSYFRLLGVRVVFVASMGQLKGIITKKSFIAHMEEIHKSHSHQPENQESNHVPLSSDHQGGHV
jgi:chloride channel 3/4/5